MMTEQTKLYIASDHAGFHLKEELRERYANLTWVDLGPTNPDRVDYPDFADKVAVALKDDPTAVGVLICGSGQGVAMRANKYPHIRAALCWSPEVAELARSHNDANVLCLGSRQTTADAAYKIFDAFIKTAFEGGRHQDRVAKLQRELK